MAKETLSIFIFTVFGLATANVNGANCSNENLNKLLKLTAEVAGRTGDFYVRSLKLARDAANENKSAKELNVELMALGDTNNKAVMPSIAQIDSILKEHPECDKENLLTLKNLKK